MDKPQFEFQKELLELKYKLKTELENLIHKNIKEEVKLANDKIDLKAREMRRGQK